MPKKPSPADAELILKLYDLRRESELRKARKWFLQFWPADFDGYNKIASAPDTQENHWMRQVLGYWEMSASLVNHGAVHADLFLEPSFSGEMFFLFAKLKPLLKDLREKASPTFLKNVETLIGSSKRSRDYFKRVEGNVASRRKAMAAKAT